MPRAVYPDLLRPEGEGGRSLPFSSHVPDEGRVTPTTTYAFTMYCGMRLGDLGLIYANNHSDVINPLDGGISTTYIKRFQFRREVKF
jgi:hypothetical protein